MFRDRTEPTLFRAGTVPETVPVRSLMPIKCRIADGPCHNSLLSTKLSRQLKNSVYSGVFTEISVDCNTLSSRLLQLQLILVRLPILPTQSHVLHMF